MKDLERILKALANRRRLTIVKTLKSGRQLTVGEIAEKINLSFKATSKHISQLVGVDVIEKDQKSVQIFCRLSEEQKPFVKQIISSL